MLAHKRFSRPPRYDHFDIPPYENIKLTRLFYYNYCVLSSAFLLFVKNVTSQHSISFVAYICYAKNSGNQAMCFLKWSGFSVFQ